MYNAVILAGGKTPWLQKAVGTNIRALAPLGGRRMVEYIIDALDQSGQIGRIIVAADGSQWEAAVLPQRAELVAVESSSMPETAAAAAALLPANSKILFVCDDIPLLTSAAVQDFLKQTEAVEADAYYPVIPEADCVKAFPGAERTYVTLPEGRFTGGNMMLLNADVISGGVIKAKDIFARRKKPWELCGWLGFGFVLKFLLHRLTLSDIELRASELLGFSGKAVVSHYPEIGMDVDKEARVKRMERVVALTKQLVDHPYQLFSFTYFCKKFEVAKSTLSEDVLAVRAGLEAYDLGRVETLAGAAGGVRFIPCHSEKANEEFLTELALQLAEPERILSGGMIYMTDLLFKPQLVMRLGEIIAQRLRHLEPEYIMTVETRGIPLAVFVARAFNIPVVMARRVGQITEGSTVSINYVSGSSKQIQTMALPKRALPSSARVLVIDDFMKAGGTARGMAELAEEVGAKVVGKAFFIATQEPEKKMIDDYTALFVLKDIDTENRKIDISPL